MCRENDTKKIKQTSGYEQLIHISRKSDNSLAVSHIEVVKLWGKKILNLEYTM
jgi:hypothetical protein